ncbi:MAG: hypothetical protein ACTSSF_11060, partial [Candidatus Heimdallarchaeaceae archaeon]
MSFERDKGDELFTQFQFKDAFIWYLKAREKFYLEGKEEELRAVEVKTARCFALLGMKDQAIDLLTELAEQAKERILLEEYFKVVLEIAATYFSYGEYLKGEEWLKELEEEVIEEKNPLIFFRYWQTQAQLKIIYHDLEEARRIVNFLMKKAKEMGNDPYFYELQVLQAQIDAEEGDILKALNNVEEAFKYFQSTPFERATFEKKIILSQFVEEPEETIKLIDDYLDRYQPEDIHPLMFNAQRIELELRSEQINAQAAIEKALRLRAEAQSIEQLELEAKINRLLAGLYQSLGENSKSFTAFKKAREYFISQELEYEEAVTFFIFLPAFLQFYSARLLGIIGRFRSSKYEGNEFLEEIDLPQEID